MDQTASGLYGNKVRVRTCGLCWKANSLLLINHRNLYGHDFWAPPGGGTEFGISSVAQLEKEFEEETGLRVRTGEFRFVCEFIKAPFHAVELFFGVEMIGGVLRTGSDPETGKGNQVITDVKFLSPEEIDRLPDLHKHGVFRMVKNAVEIKDLRGYLKI